MTMPLDKPSGVVALVGARIVTMKGNEVIERGTVLIRNNRIAAVGPQDSVQIPAGAARIDVAGKTITPGFIDIHAHMASTAGVHRTRSWAYEMNLAYGVTTTSNPQSGTTDIFTYSDRVDIGDMVGPRIYTTGPGIFSQENIRTLDEARDVLRRYADFFDTHTIKEYELSPRSTRQSDHGRARVRPHADDGGQPRPQDEHHGAARRISGSRARVPGVPAVQGRRSTRRAERNHVYADPARAVRRALERELLVRALRHRPIPRCGGSCRRTTSAQRAQRRPQWFRDDQYVFRQFAEQAKKIARCRWTALP